jgi:hypothetical protein
MDQTAIQRAALVAMRRKCENKKKRSKDAELQKSKRSKRAVQAPVLPVPVVTVLLASVASQRRMHSCCPKRDERKNER